MGETICKTLDEVASIEFGTRVVKSKVAGTQYPVYGGGGETFRIDSYNRENRVVVGRFALSKQCTRFVSGKFFLNDSGLTVKTKDETVLIQDLLDKLILYSNDLIYNLARGAGQKNLNINDFKELKISFPLNIEEQQRIVKILDKAEEIRIKKKLANEKLDEFLKSTFIDMFGDPVTNPNNYQFVCLGDLTTEICDIGSNGSNAVVAKNLKMSDTEDYAYMIRAVNFSDNNIFENMKYVSKEVYDFFRKSQIFGNEIIMCKIGSAGKFWLMPKLNKPTSLGLNSFLMRFNDNTNRIFIYHYLNTSYGQIEINTRVSGAVTKSITKGAIRTIPVYLPDIEQQNQFAQIVQKVEAQKEKHQKVIEQMDSLFNSLMQQAFKGEL